MVASQAKGQMGGTGESTPSDLSQICSATSAPLLGKRMGEEDGKVGPFPPSPQCIILYYNLFYYGVGILLNARLSWNGFAFTISFLFLLLLYRELT